MRIVVFGATGGTGKNVVERALAAGHEVIAVARRPEAIAAKHASLVVHRAEASDAAAVAAALAGADAAISAIGPRSNRAPGDVISTATRNIVAGCAAHGVKRFVLESGIMMSDGRELSALGRLAIAAARSFLPRLHADKRLAEDALRASALEWVIVRPPNLTHRPARGDYLAGPQAKIFPGKSLAHADVAACLLRAATEPAWTRQVVNVGYP